MESPHWLLWVLLAGLSFWSCDRELSPASSDSGARGSTENRPISAPSNSKRNPKESQICRAAFDTMGLTNRSFSREIYLQDRRRMVSVFESPESTPDYCYVEGDRIHWRPETVMGAIGRWRDLPDDGLLLFSIDGSRLSIRYKFLDGSVAEEDFELQLSAEETRELLLQEKRRRDAVQAPLRARIRPWYKSQYPKLREFHAELSRMANEIQAGSASNVDCENLDDWILRSSDATIWNTGDPTLDASVRSFLSFAETIRSNCRGGKQLVVFSLPGLLRKRWDEVKGRLEEVGLNP